LKLLIGTIKKSMCHHKSFFCWCIVYLRTELSLVGKIALLQHEI
jgi:hypothetical protein